MIVDIRGKTWENILLGFAIVEKLIERFFALIFKFLDFLTLKSFEDTVPFTVSDINTIKHKTLRWCLSLLITIWD